jgi:hypothetical protein
VVALAIRIETGSRNGSAVARRGTCAARESITGPDACSNCISRESCRCGSARHSYREPARRNASTRTGCFGTSGKSNCYTRAGYSDRETSGKGVGYSALEHDPEKWTSGFPKRSCSN